MQHRFISSRAVLCYAVLCCAVLSYPVLWPAAVCAHLLIVLSFGSIRDVDSLWEVTDIHFVDYSRGLLYAVSFVGSKRHARYGYNERY